MTSHLTEHQQGVLAGGIIMIAAVLSVCIAVPVVEGKRRTPIGNLNYQVNPPKPKRPG